MSYKKLEIWKEARLVSIEVHKMTLEHLPKFEMYETGGQIRRSSKTVRSSIVEGYGRRRYKADYVKFIVYALSSNDETMDHLEILWETNSLKDSNVYHILHEKVDRLGKKINRFLQSLEKNHRT